MIQTERGNKYALTALKIQRAKLAGEIASLKKRLAWAQGQIIHVDATLHLMDPAYAEASVTPRKTYKRMKLYRQGELGRMVIDTLRRAGKPMGTQEVVTALLAAGGHGESVRAALAPRVRSNLHYQEGRGLVVRTGRGKSVVWALASV